MLLSELLGVTVVDTDGRKLGRVHDVLLVQDGPMTNQGLAQLRLHAIAVGKRSFGTQLGYAQGTVQGPWLLRRVLGRDPEVIPWDAVVHHDPDRIVVDSRTSVEDGA
jgi:sporulation protein YlmC with PRC-barrel domain